mmetsp:Transcript_59461/g.150684  ORF Transcript_59461/g.150684 Transcript_59461/m.150684 type:complete len:450 (+) Transcript_59461:56-1405(+)
MFTMAALLVASARACVADLGIMAGHASTACSSDYQVMMPAVRSGPALPIDCEGCDHRGPWRGEGEEEEETDDDWTAAVQVRTIQGQPPVRFHEPPRVRTDALRLEVAGRLASSLHRPLLLHTSITNSAVATSAAAPSLALLHAATTTSITAIAESRSLREQSKLLAQEVSSSRATGAALEAERERLQRQSALLERQLKMAIITAKDAPAWGHKLSHTALLGAFTIVLACMVALTVVACRLHNHSQTAPPRVAEETARLRATMQDRRSGSLVHEGDGKHKHHTRHHRHGFASWCTGAASSAWDTALCLRSCLCGCSYGTAVAAWTFAVLWSSGLVVLWHFHLVQPLLSQVVVYMYLFFAFLGMMIVTFLESWRHLHRMLQDVGATSKFVHDKVDKILHLLGLQELPDSAGEDSSPSTAAADSPYRVQRSKSMTSIPSLPGVGRSFKKACC